MNYQTILEQIKGRKILIIGDVMLDHYIFGQVNRLSPEAPIPIVDVERKEYRLGGAGNVATNIKALGGEPYLVSIVGANESKQLDDSMMSDISIIRRLVEDNLYHYLHEIEDILPTVKSRIFVGARQVLRYDKEENAMFAKAEQDGIFQNLQAHRFDAVILSDYDKGVVTPYLISEVVRIFKGRCPIIADPKGKDFNEYNGVTAITPNKKEYDSQLQTSDSPYTHPDIVLRTDGADGMILFNGTNVSFERISGHQVNAVDVCGAGDTVTAAFTLGLSAGISPLDSAKFANKAASIAVQHLGTYAVKASDFDEG